MANPVGRRKDVTFENKGEEEDMQTNKTRIWSGEHGAWWRPSSSGYSTNIDDAGIYDHDDAVRRTRGCGPEKKIKLVPTTTMDAAVSDIRAERQRQNLKWGEQNYDPFTYLAILMEEVGEFSQAALHQRFGGDSDKNCGNNLYKEAVHAAAVAQAIVECLNRDKWEWPATKEETE